MKWLPGDFPPVKMSHCLWNRQTQVRRLFYLALSHFDSNLIGGKVIGVDPVQSRDLTSVCQRQIKTGGVNPRLMSPRLPPRLNGTIMFPYSLLTYEVIWLRDGPVPDTW